MVSAISGSQTTCIQYKSMCIQRRMPLPDGGPAAAGEGPADTDGGPEAAGNGSIAGDGLAATS